MSIINIIESIINTDDINMPTPRFVQSQKVRYKLNVCDYTQHMYMYMNYTNVITCYVFFIQHSYFYFTIVFLL